MAKGKTYPHERIRRIDPDTGVEMLQLASFPLISHHFPYTYRNLTHGFTADGRTLVFFGLRAAERGAPWDLFRVDVDGANLAQLTEREHIGGVVPSNTRRVVYFMDRGTLWSVDVDTFAEEEIAHIDAKSPRDTGGEFRHSSLVGCISPDDRWYFVPAHDPDGRAVILRYATDEGDARIFREWDGLHCADPQGRGVMLQVREGERGRFVVVDFEGNEVARYGWNVFAHSCPLGRSGLWQGCALYPTRAILTMAEGQDEAEPLVEGPYFWHSSGSLDGEWIVADTNWPNEGLQLVCVKTRRFKTLLHPHNSGGHPQWGHPHPFFSPDRRYVAFNSDWTGVGQVYVAEVPQELYDELARG